MLARGRYLWILTVASMLLVPAGDGSAQTGTKVRVEPAITETTEPLDDRKFATTLRYFNDGVTRAKLQLSVRILEHDEFGKTVTRASPTIQEAFSLSASSLDLAPQASEEVRLSGAIPASERSAYPVVVAFQGGGQGTNVVVNSEILSTFYLRGPKPWDERVAITDIGILERDGNQLTLFAKLRNTGNVHVKPVGAIEIRSGGKVIGRSSLEPPGVAILPSCKGGCVRRLTAKMTIDPRIDGPLEIFVTVRNPDARARASVPLPGGKSDAKPTASILFTSVTERSIEALATNTASVTLPQPSVHLEALAAEDERTAQQTFPLTDLAPKDSSPVRWSPALPEGRYRIVARVLSGATVLAESEAKLTVGNPPDPARAPLSLIALALLFVLAVVLFLLWKRPRFIRIGAR